jgi:hypothetical protein
VLKWMSRRRRSTRDRTEDRWHGRPILSAVVSVVFITPIALSIVSATIAAHVLPHPRGTDWWLGWWAVVLGVPTVMLVATDRIARRALPLAVLLKMTMVFPDRAPKRLAVARKSGSTRDLARRVEEARTHGVADEPVLAAEKILALAGALNAHDRLTRGHGERVRAFTDLIAEELDLPTDDRDRLRWSALLHDIGKLAVHPDILNKPGKLNEDEWAIIKGHPLEGAELTAPLAPWLGQWANTIAEHHEKYDGTGYPYGLTGNEISLGGRIVAVADCYDTMTAIRTYRQPISREAARNELAACAGSHFDPTVVRAFLDVSIGRIRPVAGPLAWLGSLPFVGNFPQIGQVVAIIGRAGAATVTVAGAVTAGALHAVAGTDGHPPNRLAVGSGSTTAGIGSTGSPVGSAPQQGKAGSPGGGSTLKVGSPSTTTSPRRGAGSPVSGVPATTHPVVGGPTTTTNAGSPPPTSTTTRPAQLTGSLMIRNGTGQAGRAQQGDQIIVTFLPSPAPGAFCSAWSASSYSDLARPNVQVSMIFAAGDDMVTSVVDSSDCKGGFHFGTIDLGQAGYVNTSATFGGGANSQCNGNTSTGCTTIHWDGQNTLTITLGQESTGQPTQSAPSVAVFTPDAALGLTGTIRSVMEEHF